ncbi:winged helix-turn-helix transcriptional regulator [Chryseobacterium sp. MIQD13]|uniref:winged helix-turn-helix transcriptional regulator n=1 Tax=Chryseobacterium sp. MIQD13 TaxID=3422310 RepID=UPI003D299136
METKRKNKDFNPHNCGVTHFLNKVGGKWKVLVIFSIDKGHNRFSSMQKIIPQISKQMLINQLRELEEDNIIERTVYAEIPPRVEYNISKYGKSILPLITAIQDWGLKDMNKKEC